jgi:hypothetical protein
MAIHIRVIILMEKLMVKEYIYGKMEKLIVDNLKMVKKKVMVFGRELKEILIWEIGILIKLKDMEFMYG